MRWEGRFGRIDIVARGIRGRGGGRKSDRIKEKIDTCVSADKSVRESSVSQKLLLPIGKSLSRFNSEISHCKGGKFFIFA